MDFLDEHLTEYINKHTSIEPPVLAELNRETWAGVLLPRMLSGHLQGRVLSMLSHLVQPKAVLEIGTYTGYSAICLAEGLAIGGTVTTIDINDELEEMIQKYIAKSGNNGKINFVAGDATQIIPTLAGPFDLVFIDADKENYSNYFDLVIDKLRPGGLLIADNVLWSGNVLKPQNEMDEETKAIAAFNQKVHKDERVEHVLVPVRDGLMVCRRR